MLLGYIISIYNGFNVMSATRFCHLHCKTSTGGHVEGQQLLATDKQLIAFLGSRHSHSNYNREATFFIHDAFFTGCEPIASILIKPCRKTAKRAFAD